MSSFTSEYEVWVGPSDEDYVTFTLHCHYTPGDPGRTWGRPEDCYPGSDPEVEVEDITSPDGRSWSDKDFELLVSWSEDRVFKMSDLDDRLIEDACEREVDAEYEEADRYYDMMREDERGDRWGDY
jgi:hypothetical protein